MKNKLIALVAALALGLGLSSCNETFAPNVDFGDKTYINDYSALVAQVKNLVDKIDLLNKIIDDNYDQLVVSIDGLTQAITIQTETMDADMDRIVATLTEGFTALKTTIDYAGFSIVSAINTEGELISLKFDQNGKLIEAAILGKDGAIAKAVVAGTAEIVEAIGTQGSSLLAELQAGNATALSILDGLGATEVQLDSLEAILHRIEDLEEVDLSEIIRLLGINNDLLTEILAISDGIYLNEDDFDESKGLYRKIYMTNEAYAAAQLSSKTDEAVKAMLAEECNIQRLQGYDSRAEIFYN